MNESKIRVLIVDDSLTVRKRVVEILEKTQDITVAGEAKDGKEAIEQAKKLHPDIILMDIVMPVMSGLVATEYIMAHHPTAIVVHSSCKNRGEAYKTLDVMKAGALTSIEKSDAIEATDKWVKNLFRTIRAASRVKVLKRREPMVKRQRELSKPVEKRVCENYNIIALGVSTGGPKVVADILSAFPSDFRLPVLLIIHTADSSIFCSWLNDNCNLRAAFASDGERLNGQQGRVLVAPTGKHLKVEESRIKLCDSPPVNFCKPSINVLFNSLALDKTLRPIAVLLTGMGEDGARGLKAIRDSGGYAICQDEETSIIFGMPKAAIDLGAADVILPDYQIASEILSLTNTR